MHRDKLLISKTLQQHRTFLEISLPAAPCRLKKARGGAKIRLLIDGFSLPDFVDYTAQSLTDTVDNTADDFDDASKLRPLSTLNKIESLDAGDEV